MVKAEEATEGDWIGAFVEIPKDTCLLSYARVSSTIEDVDMAIYADDGTLQPVTYVIAPAVAPAVYAIDLALVRADDTVLGQTVCRATTSPGLSSSAVCDPVN